MPRYRVFNASVNWILGKCFERVRIVFQTDSQTNSKNRQAELKTPELRRRPLQPLSCHSSASASSSCAFQPAEKEKSLAELEQNLRAAMERYARLHRAFQPIQQPPPPGAKDNVSS